MSLSNDLLSQFVKVNKDNTKPKTETTVYGTTVEYEGKTYVRLDGSDLLTPVESTVATQPDERVTVMIKDHTATITGNLSSPSARKDDVDGLASQISEFEILVADVVYTDELNAEIARIDQLVAEDALIRGELKAGTARIDELIAKDAEITGKLTANEAEIADLKTGKLDAEIADIKYATIESLNATNADIHNLSATFGDFEQLTAKNFEAVNGTFESLDSKYANIDFANIGEAAIEKIFADSGLIKDLTVSSGTITGELVGVTIKGDLIEANTLKADALVVKGEDGLYYKLNFESGNFTSAEEVPDDGLHGSVIIAKSITADRIAVTDLVAFGATIGGFMITNNAIHSVVKTSVDNTTRGFYVDNDGQFAIGDSYNFIKYYLDTDGKYKLAISAGSMILSSRNQTVEEALDDMQNTVDGLDKIEIGGRNLLRDTKAFGGEFSTNTTEISDETYDGFTVRHCANTSDSLAEVLRIDGVMPIDSYGQQYTFSFYAKGSSQIRVGVSYTVTPSHIKSSTGVNAENLSYCYITLSEKWTRYWVTWTAGNTGTLGTAQDIYIDLKSGGELHICGCKLEKGNKATDWTPAPEDGEDAVANAQDTANNAQSAATDAQGRVEVAEATLQILADSISSLVTDENGTSLMTQTADGWTFNLSTVTETINSTSETLNDLSGKVDGVDETINNLNSLVDDLGKKTAYITMTTDANGDPCIELGKSDNDFKVRITNTSVDFLEGSSRIAYVSNRSLYIEKAIIKDELQIGEGTGFIWKRRSNGNLGLRWIGG